MTDITGALVVGARFWKALAEDDDGTLAEVISWSLGEWMSNLDELSVAGGIRVRIVVTAAECAAMDRFGDGAEIMPGGRVRISYWRPLGGPPASGEVWVWYLAFIDEGDGWRVHSINDRSERGAASTVHRTPAPRPRSLH